MAIKKSLIYAGLILRERNICDTALSQIVSLTALMVSRAMMVSTAVAASMVL